MDDAPPRLDPHEGPTKHPANIHPPSGRFGRRRIKAMITRKPPRWPASGNAARQLAMENEERAAQIARELLRCPEVQANSNLKALVFELMALAEQSRRALGEARPE